MGFGGSLASALGSVGGGKSTLATDDAYGENGLFGMGNIDNSWWGQASNKLGFGPGSRPDRPNMNPFTVNADAFNPSERQNKMWAANQGAMDTASRRDAHQMQSARIDPRMQAEFRKRQLGLADQLSQQAQGKGPSLANMQLEQATDRGMSQMRGSMASQRGLSAGQRARMMSQMSGQLQADAGRNAAMTRMQEQMGARQQLAGVLGSARGQDLGLASSQAQLQQGANQANLQSNITNQAQKDAYMMALKNQQMGIANSDQNAAMALEKLKSANHNAVLTGNMGMYGSDVKAHTDNKMGIMGGLGTVLAAYSGGGS